MVFKKSFFRLRMLNSRPPPFIEKVIFNFHFDYLTISNARPHEISIPIQYWKLSTPAPARQKTHYAHCRFWSILAQISIGFCDGKFFLTKSWNLQELIINTRGTFEPKSPKVLQKYDLGGGQKSVKFFVCPYLSTEWWNLWAKYSEWKIYKKEFFFSEIQPVEVEFAVQKNLPIVIVSLSAGLKNASYQWSPSAVSFHFTRKIVTSSGGLLGWVQETSSLLSN